MKYRVYALVECLSVNVSGIFINGRSTKIALQKMIKQALDLGVNFIDTANNVCACGTSEEFIGGALKTLGVKREDVVLATKCILMRENFPAAQLKEKLMEAFNVWALTM